ncbi:MAG: CoA-binding protein, partial [Candidatus Methylarchaceae archaeon HK01B]|nr:CoA-binding protein [Candidatus Methylarchaceae archaeon HK01B]
MENRMKSFFEPASVAAIGASHKKTKVGNVVFHNLLMNKERGIFKGEIYPVNPKYTEVLGIK